MLQRLPDDRFEAGFKADALVAELPPAPRLRRVVGPGVILLATAVGSGELLFWPGITATHGFQFLWLMVGALVAQYVLNTEFARYTLATGEPIVAGYVRLWRGFTWVFLAAAILPWIWPGWASGGAQAIQWLAGGSVAWIAAASLVAIGVLLTAGRAAYRALEATQAWLVAYILVVLVLTAIVVVRWPTLQAAGAGLGQSPFPLPPALPLATLLAALVFCGAGGTINLAVSNWVRDKGFGLAAHAPKIINPFTGTQVAEGAGAFRFEGTPEQLGRWRSWWRLARREQQVTFLAGSVLGLALPMLIAYPLVRDRGLGVGTDAVRVEATLLGDIGGPVLEVAFVIAVAAIFLTSALGVLDHAARLSASLLAPRLVGRAPSRWRSESGLYFLTLWGMIAFGLFVLLGLNVSDPPALLTLAGSLSGIVMFVYAGLTLWLHRRMHRLYAASGGGFATDNPFRLSLFRLAALAFATLLYGLLSIAVVQDAATKAFG